MINLIIAIVIIAAAAIFLYAGHNRPSDKPIYRNALRNKYYSQKP